jgi:hypothetical protein
MKCVGIWLEEQGARLQWLAWRSVDYASQDWHKRLIVKIHDIGQLVARLGYRLVETA